MSKTTKIKHVTKAVLEEYVLPSEQQQIVRILSGRGNNLHEVENSTGETFLVSMPTKFRKSVWVKRGDFVIVDPIEEGDRVKAEIAHILYKDQIKYIKEEGKWPKGFEEQNCDGINAKSSDSEDEDEDSELFVNTNRPNVVYEESDSSEDTE
uniref:Probable RNA-binding protein EIF1AD n=1 Tax=Ornithodoros moubata TaxID=6938 RepID=A0A1Z5L809_ORNMO